MKPFIPDQQNSRRTKNFQIRRLFGFVGLIVFFMAAGIYAYFWWNAPTSQITTSRVKIGRGGVVSNPKQVEYLLAAQTNTQILDPQMTTASEEIFINALFDGLAEYDSSGTKLEPSLAVSWSKNEDSTVWTFNLRNDAKWTNGSSITASDFVYSWLRELNPETKAVNPQFLYYIKNAGKFNQNQARAEEVGVKALDDFTFQVTMEKPNPFFDKLITNSKFRPVPREVVEKFGKDWTKPGNIVTSGAFFLETYPSPGEISVIRRDDFWDSQHTWLDKIKFYSPNYDEFRGKSPLELFESKRISVTCNLESFRDNQDLLTGMSNGVSFLSINTTIKPFNEVRVRKALSLAIDREKLKEGGLSPYPTTSFTPPFENYENEKGAGFNPHGARRLLAEAGFPNGKHFPKVEYIYYQTEKNEAVAKFVQTQLEKELRLKIKLNGLGFNDFSQKWMELDYKGMALVDWAGDYPDPNSFLEVFRSDKPGIGWKDENYDDFLQNAGIESDPVKRFVFLKEAENLLTEQLPAIPLFIASNTILCRPFVKNFVPNPTGQVNWRKVEVDENLNK